MAAEFIRAGGADDKAPSFARMIESLARAVPAPLYSVKERRRLTQQAATALRNAADALAKLDGVSVTAAAAAAAAYRAEFMMRDNPHPFGSQAYAEHVYAEQRRVQDEPALRNHPPVGGSRFAFGRHGLPANPARIRPQELRTMEAVAAMVADLELLAIGADRAARAELSHPTNSLEVLARSVVDTLHAFDVVPTATLQGLAHHCMQVVMKARGDNTDDIDAPGYGALRKAIREKTGKKS